MGAQEAVDIYLQLGFHQAVYNDGKYNELPKPLKESSSVAAHLQTRETLKYKGVILAV